MSLQKEAARSDVMSLVAVFTCGFAVSGLAILKPLIVGGLIEDYRFTPAQAGLVAGIEMVGIAVAAFVLAAAGGAWDRRRVVIVGATLGILGSVGPVSSDEFVVILISRAVAGAGCGVVASVMLSLVGSSRDPDRTFGLYYATTYVGASVLVVLGARVFAMYGVVGGYTLLALMLTLIYMACGHIPRRFQATAVAHPAGGPAPLAATKAATSLFGYFLFCAGLGGTWAFIERLGHHNGVAEAAIAQVLAIGPYASVAGALTAAAVRTRLGRLLPTATSVGLAVLSAMLLSLATQPVSFAAGVLVFSFAWSLFLAYLGGLLAAQDSAGRVVAMSITSQTLGMAAGPAVAGFIVGSFGYHALAAMSCTFYLGGFVFLLRALADHSGRAATSESCTAKPVCDSQAP